MNRKERRSRKSRDGAGNGKSPADIALMTRDALQAARTCDTRGHRAEAEKILTDLLRLNPTCAPALHNLGLWAAQRGDYAAAEKYFATLYKLEPQNRDTACSLAVARIEQGKDAAAQPLIDSILADNESSIATLNRLGNLCREAGMLETALAIFETAARRAPETAVTYYNMRRLRRFDADDPIAERIAAIYARREALSAKDRAYIGFTLSDILAAQGDDDAAFACLEDANNAQRSIFGGSDIAQVEKHVDNVIAAFTPAIAAGLRQKHAAATQAAKPVFIIGMPRSGSTLVDQILASHPQAASLGESSFFSASLSAAGGAPRSLQEFAAGLTEKSCDAIGQQYLANTAAATSGKALIADKQLFNYLWLGVIIPALPGAKIIHCTRDARDIGLSIWRTLFTSNLQWAYHQQEIARYYNAYEKLMRHWQNLYPDAWLTVAYEEMTEDPAYQTERILDYCDLPWDDACLRFYETRRTVKTASVEQVRQPVYRNAVGQWKRYEKHLKSMLQALDDGKPKP